MTRIRALEAGGRNSHIPQPEADRRLDPSCCLTANLTDARRRFRRGGDPSARQRKGFASEGIASAPVAGEGFRRSADDIGWPAGGVHACLISTM